MIETPEQLIDALRQAPTDVQVTAPLSVWLAIIGMAQLGLRHPHVPALPEQAVRQWIEGFAQNLPPELADHVRSGFDPACDVPPLPKGMIKHG